MLPRSVFAASALLASMLTACGGSDPSETALESTSTVAVDLVETSTTEAAAETPDIDVTCGSELALFPTESITPSDVVDVDGRLGPAPDGEPTGVNQLVRHWVGQDDVVLEMRWPAGSGPDVGDAVTVTQLIETGEPPPCDTVRVSAYGPEGPAIDVFAAFVDSLEGLDAKSSFIQAQAEAQTVATAVEPGRCTEPIYTELDEFGEPDLVQVGQLLSNYIEDRNNGAGFEECFTVAALRQLLEAVAENGEPDMVRPAGPPDSSTVEVVATYLDRDPLLVLREQLRISTVDEGGRHRLLFGSVMTGPDSYVGESEAVAFIDEFLLLLADEDYESAAGYLINEGAGEDVLAAIPKLLDDGNAAEALRDYCSSAMCAATYKIGGTVEFETNSRLIDVTFSGARGTIEVPMRVAVFEARLSILTPPPLPPE